MNKKFVICFVLFVLSCSPAFASPYLWASHNTIVNMAPSANPESYVPASMDTARFLSVTLEAADYDADMPQFDVDMNDRDSIPKLTVTGGKYSYWNGDMVKTVDGTTEKFDIVRSDILLPENHGTLLGSDNRGYIPMNAS